jgi:hypothetical protein
MSLIEIQVIIGNEICDSSVHVVLLFLNNLVFDVHSTLNEEFENIFLLFDALSEAICQSKLLYSFSTQSMAKRYNIGFDFFCLSN